MVPGKRRDRFREDIVGYIFSGLHIFAQRINVQKNLIVVSFIRFGQKPLIHYLIPYTPSQRENYLISLMSACREASCRSPCMLMPPDGIYVPSS